MIRVLTPTITAGPVNITPATLCIKMRKVIKKVKTCFISHAPKITNTASYIHVAPVMRIGALFEVGGVGLVCL